MSTASEAATRTPLLARVALGLWVGGVWGLLELFVRPSPRYVLAGVVAGGAYVAMMVIAAEWRWWMAWSGMLAGAITGALWSLVSASSLPIVVACVVGAILGAVAARFG